MPISDRLVLVDIETTGLDPKINLILEVGVMIVDLDLNIIDDFQICLWDSPMYDMFISRWAKDPMNEYANGMHSKNQLWDECRAVGVPVLEATAKLEGFLVGHGLTKNEPMCGSSVAFDRGYLLEHMPTVESMFHYRNVDVSTLKELCAAYNPNVYATLKETVIPLEIHRVLPDLQDTVGELSYYLKNFTAAFLNG